MDATIKVSTKKVKETKVFKGLTAIRKKIFSTRNNVKIIENGVNIANHKGFERFEKEHDFAYINRLIIKELTDVRQ